MNELLKRKENETDFEYGLRLIEAKCEKTIDLDWQDIVELLDLNCHRDSLRKACSVTEFSAYNVMKYFKDKIESTIVEKSEGNNIKKLIKELEEKTLEFEKEKIRFQDQRREYKKLYRPEARFERILEVTEREIKSINNIKPFTYKAKEKTSGKNEAVLMVSDWHIDAMFKHAFGEYNLEIAKERIQELLDKTITYCKANDVSTLHIELLGDNISGGIHWSSKVESEEDCISQVMTLCELLSHFIGEISKHIDNIKVYSVIGNHSRINMNKKDNMLGENLERLVPFYLKARLVDLKNVIIDDSANIDDTIIMYDVLNTKIIGVHGDLDRPTQIVSNLTKMLRVFADEYHLGHLHHHYEKEEYDMEVVINGSLQGTDTYAKDIRKSGKPMQKLMIYNDDGKLCTYKIKL